MSNDEKLAKYEATGLTPEQAMFCKEVIDSAFGKDTSFAERLRELSKADRENRLIVLPCSEGTQYFSIEMFCTECGYYPDPEPHKMWVCEECNTDYCDKSYRVVEHRFSSKGDVYEKRNWVGKSIWLTREEAEAKCKEMEGNK